MATSRNPNKKTTFGVAKNRHYAKEIVAPNGKTYKYLELNIENGFVEKVGEIALEEALCNKDGKFDPLDNEFIYYAEDTETIGDIIHTIVCG